MLIKNILKTLVLIFIIAITVLEVERVDSTFGAFNVYRVCIDGYEYVITEGINRFNPTSPSVIQSMIPGTAKTPTPKPCKGAEQ